MSKQEDAAAPAELWLRCVPVRVRQRGFRTRRLVVATTLWDRDVTAPDLAELHRRRWQAEINQAGHRPSDRLYLGSLAA
jgi:hypothetical protein